jgi:hypothetical protein
MLQVAVKPWRVALNEHEGGFNFATKALQVVLPSWPLTVAVSDVSEVWLQVIVLLAGVFPSQLRVLPRIVKLEMLPAGEVLVNV